MDVEPVFQEDRVYSVSELADIFGVANNTIRRWANDDKLPCDRDPDGSRQFHGPEIMRAVKNDDHLLDKLGEAHGLVNSHDQLRELFSTIERLQEELEEKENELARQNDLRDLILTEHQKLSERLQEEVQTGLEQLEEEMDEFRQEMKRRLPSGREEKKRSLASYIPIIGRFIGT